MPTYLLDTNHLGRAVKGGASGSDLRNELSRRRAQGDRIGTCAPVLCELEIGILQTRDPDAYRRSLRSLVRQLRVWPLDGETARIYGTLWLDLRGRGRVLSQVDVMIAALAIQHALVVLSTDKDFDALPQLRRENWLAD